MESKDEIRPFHVQPIPQELIDGDLGYDEDGFKINNLNEMQQIIDDSSLVSPVMRGEITPMKEQLPSQRIKELEINIHKEAEDGRYTIKSWYALHLAIVQYLDEQHKL